MVNCDCGVWIRENSDILRNLKKILSCFWCLFYQQSCPEKQRGNRCWLFPGSCPNSFIPRFTSLSLTNPATCNQIHIILVFVVKIYININSVKVLIDYSLNIVHNFWPRDSLGVHYLLLTYLQLSLDPSFASFPKGHLGLIVLGHGLHKLPGQDCVLRTSESTRADGDNLGRLQTFMN